jgi:hypothetical protein
LRQAARLLRGQGTDVPGRERAELLRTLGQELDAQEVPLERVVDAGEGYLVTLANATVQYYALHELRHRSQVRCAARTTAPLAVPQEDLPPLRAEVSPPFPEMTDPAVPSRRRGPWWLFRAG